MKAKVQCIRADPQACKGCYHSEPHERENVPHLGGCSVSEWCTLWAECDVTGTVGDEWPKVRCCRIPADREEQ